MYRFHTFRSLCPQNVVRFQIIRSLYPQKRDTFCVFAILGMASGGAYAIRPYTGSQKINTFSRSIMYPVNFLGLGRGLDFLLPSFLSSRKEKKVVEWGQIPRFSDPKINIPGK